MKEEILNYLAELSGGKKGRISFTLNDALSRIGITKEELNRDLLSLQEEGVIRIVRIPTSPEVKEWLYQKLSNLTGLFIVGEINRDEYLERWAKFGASSLSKSLGSDRWIGKGSKIYRKTHREKERYIC